MSMLTLDSADEWKDGYNEQKKKKFNCIAVIYFKSILITSGAISTTQIIS